MSGDDEPMTTTQPGAQRKMLDRDLSTLERAGVQIARQGTTRGAVYRVSLTRIALAPDVLGAHQQGAQ